MQKIEAILQAIMVPGMSSLLLGVLATLAMNYVQLIKDARLRQFVTDLVQAAEQVYGSGTGSQKMAYVVQQAQALGVKGVTPAHVEAAVYGVRKGSVSGQ
jgi:hypothetical protein